jgi:hypothetical protein
MNTLFAIIAFILIYPIIWLMPFRIKAKQKFLLLIIALFISITGIASKNILLFWQTIVIMVALAGLASILISKRMVNIEDTVPFSQEKEKTYFESIPTINSTFDQDETVIEEEKVFSLNEKDEFIEDLKDTSLAIEVESDHLIIGNIQEKITLNELEDDDFIDTIFEGLQAELYVASSLENDEKLEGDEGLIEFEEFSFEEPELTNGKISQIDPVTVESSHYLSEIEKLLQEEENESLIVLEEEKVKTVSDKEQLIAIKEIKLEKLY